MKVLGIILIVLGVLTFIYTGFSYTTEETVAEVGPIEINADKEHSFGWSPIVGIVLVIGGVIALLADRKGR